MNTFYMYTLSLADYEDLVNNDRLTLDQRRIRLNNHLLVSGTNRRIITMILRLNGLEEVKEGEVPEDCFDVHTFSMRYEQIQELVQQELQIAAGHFSHTLHKVNLAAFYYLSFAVKREITVVLVKNELPDGVVERNNWEGISPSMGMSRFYYDELDYGL